MTIKKLILTVACLAVYLNIGWAIGDYMHGNVTYKKSSEIQTITAKFLAGPGQWIVDHDVPENLRMSRALLSAILSILWPLFLVMVIMSWIFWFIFLGGLVKLMGLA